MTQEKNTDFSSYLETGFPIHGYHTHNNVSEEDHKQLTATYYGMISMMDKYVGQILDKLDELCIAENTIIMLQAIMAIFSASMGCNIKADFTMKI